MPKKESEDKKLQGRPSIDKQKTSGIDEYQAQLITTFTELIKIMIPLGDVINSDEFTPSQREKVRELAGNGALISRLVCLLTSMSGEGARQVLGEHKKRIG
jgi:hypothetical protein